MRHEFRDMSMDRSLLIERIVSVPLVDLGAAGDPQFSGIFAPRDFQAFAPGVTSQFLEDAGIYHEKYFNTDHTTWLIKAALKAINASDQASLVLNIGSGSGPTVLSLQELLPQAHVVATDISPNLLAILRSTLVKRGGSDRCTTLCLDLNKRWFTGQPFDLAIGSAILHHLFDPFELIAQVFPAVRSGGAAIFFEPFEPGHVMMSMIYRTLLSEASYSRPLRGAVVDFFAGKVAEIMLRKCEPKDPGLYARTDDKWLFTRSYFERIGERVGASKTIIYPLYDSERPFTDQMKTALRLGLGFDENYLGPWAWQVISDIEAAVSESCKEDLITEGCVAFIK